MSTDTQIAMAISAIEDAAFEPARWDDALLAIARATGSRAAQLCAMGPSDALSFNRLPGVDPDILAEWTARGFDDPAINSRVRIGVRAPILRSLDERSFTTQEDGRDCPDYADLIDRVGLPYICLTNLVRAPREHVGFAVLRDRDQGNIESGDRRIFDHLARHVQRAIHMSQTIGTREASAIARGMDAIRVAAFICDTSGRIIATSAEAEASIANDPYLSLVDRHLIERRTGRNLSMRAVATVSGSDICMPPVVINTEDGRLPLLVEFAPLPAGAPGFPGIPGAIITIRKPWSRTGSLIERHVRPLYGLTMREAEVAAGLCQGMTPQQLASTLSVGLGTIRTHIRHLLEKTHTKTLAQLVATLGAYDS